jgi:two-component system, OmpR family, KDP operon response regulator KdpE
VKSGRPEQTIHHSPPDTVLVIDDEPQIRRAVSDAFVARGHRVLEVATGRAGINIAATAQPQLIVLDLGLPDMQGADVCRAVRAWTQTPIIVLSARHSEDEKVRLLAAGADDYVTKPFSLRELEARAEVQLRRGRRETERESSVVVAGDIRIDFGGRRVTRGGRDVKLTPVEWRVLNTLAANAGRILTQRQLFEAVWSRAYGNASQHLRVHITHLRRKIEPNPSRPVLILTEPGVGYRFEYPEEIGE